MKQRRRIYYTDGQKALMWERWRKGESLQQVFSASLRHQLFGSLVAKSPQRVIAIPKQRASHVSGDIGCSSDDRGASRMYFCTFSAPGRRVTVLRWTWASRASVCMSMCSAAAKRRAETVGATLYESLKDVMNWSKLRGGAAFGARSWFIADWLVHTICTFMAQAVLTMLAAETVIHCAAGCRVPSRHPRNGRLF